MHPLTLVAALVVSQPEVKALDISAWKANARALTDGKGRYFVYDAERPYETLFYGDGKTLVEQRTFGGSREAKAAWSAYFWEPRIVRGTGDASLIQMKDSGRFFTCVCGNRETALSPVGAEETQALLGAAVFVPPTWTRRPERLLRDDRGTYYFVDRLRTDDERDRRDFRIFVGPRGKMKQVPLKDVVDDSEGMIFSTKDGELRLVFANQRDPASKEAFKWVDGKQTRMLTLVPLESATNVRLIYVDLGPYLGARLGTPCDDLM